MVQIDFDFGGVSVSDTPRSIATAFIRFFASAQFAGCVLTSRLHNTEPGGFVPQAGSSSLISGEQDEEK